MAAVREQPRKEFPIHRRVVDDKDPQRLVMYRRARELASCIWIFGVVLCFCVERRRRAQLQALQTWREGLVRDVVQREGDGERRSFSKASGECRKRSSVLIANSFGNVEAKTTPVSCLKIVSVELDSLSKQSSDLLRGHSGTRVRNCQAEAATMLKGHIFLTIIQREVVDGTPTAILFIKLVPRNLD